jgi:hypothetical protein
MKTIYSIGIRTLVVVGVLASLSIIVSSEASAHTIEACDSGTELSFDQAIDSIAWGLIIIDRVPDLTAHNVTVTVTNNTPCNLPASLSNHKMYIDYSLATLSQQEFFTGTPTRMVAASTTEVFVTPIATCMSQYDLWYGDYLVVIPDFLTWGKLLSGDQVRLGEYCVMAPVQANLFVVKNVINDNGGTSTPASFNIRVTAAGALVPGDAFPGMEAPGRVYVSGMGLYTISEDAASGYAATFSGDCDASGVITLTDASDKTCIVTNDDIALPAAPIVPVVPIVVTPPVVAPVVTSASTVTVTSEPVFVPPSSSSGGHRRTAVVETVDIMPEVVTVFVPGLPDTGFGPLGKSMLLNFASLLGLIGLVFFLKLDLSKLIRS